MGAHEGPERTGEKACRVRRKVEKTACRRWCYKYLRSPYESRGAGPIGQDNLGRRGKNASPFSPFWSTRGVHLRLTDALLCAGKRPGSGMPLKGTPPQESQTTVGMRKRSPRSRMPGVDSSAGRRRRVIAEAPPGVAGGEGKRQRLLTSCTISDVTTRVIHPSLFIAAAENRVQCVPSSHTACQQARHAGRVLAVADSELEGPGAGSQRKSRLIPHYRPNPVGTDSIGSHKDVELVKQRRSKKTGDSSPCSKHPPGYAVERERERERRGKRESRGPSYHPELCSHWSSPDGLVLCHRTPDSRARERERD
jgi:hypothetical protein